jgi:hypothetical protein
VTGAQASCLQRRVFQRRQPFISPQDRVIPAVVRDEATLIAGRMPAVQSQDSGNPKSKIRNKKNPPCDWEVSQGGMLWVWHSSLNLF